MSCLPTLLACKLSISTGTGVLCLAGVSLAGNL
jgi:hypothetical protein